MFQLVLIILTFAMVQASTSRAESETEAPPEVWLCAGDRIYDLLEPDAEWPFVKEHLAGIKLYIGQLNSPRRSTPEQAQAFDARLRRLARFLKENELQVAVELGGCLDFSPLDDTAGEWSARHELASIDRFYAAGGKVDFLDLDGPIRRLMHPDRRTDGKRFDSIDAAADELVDALQLHKAAHPETRYWLLTNFPNWGWRGDVSYHARGPLEMDYGDYNQVLRIVLRKFNSAGIALDGLTVDNPYDYLVGEHTSVNLADPKVIDWLTRVRSLEDFARRAALRFNLIANSERGGHQSDELFARDTLQMVDTYLKAGGRPDRWFVQSWYPYPKQMAPESTTSSLTGLAKAVIERVIEAPPPPLPQRLREVDEGGQIKLQPRPGSMQVTAKVPHLGNQGFALVIPETIGCREAMLLNFPEAKIEWKGPDNDGAVSCLWSPGGRIFYSLRLIPASDYIDIEMTVRNLTEFVWHDVFAFHCLNPIQAPAFQDWELSRTYMNQNGRPLCMAETERVEGPMPTVGFYLPEKTAPGEESIFVHGFSATSPDRTDGNYIVTFSRPEGAYMAATAVQIAFLFDNLDRACIHAAPCFGDLGPGQAATTVSRLYFARGDLDDFIQRMKHDRSELEARHREAFDAGPVR
jgi:hypothetical protein